MSLNWKEIDLVLAEIDLPGAHVQGAVQPGYDSLCLELYKPGRAFTLFISIASGGCRIHETAKNVPKTKKPLRFQEFIKSRLIGAKITAAAQLGDERVVRIDLERGGEKLMLYARLWSNAANVILTDIDNVIMDAMSRRPKRGEISGGTYRPEALLESANAISGKKQRAAKPLEARNFPGEGSLSARIEAFFDSGVGTLSLEALSKRIDSLFNQRTSLIEGSIESMERTLSEFGMADTYRLYGELLLSNPGAQVTGGSVEVADYLEPGKHVCIRVEPGKSLKECAQTYFDRAKKAKSGRADVERELAQARVDLAAQSALWEKLKKEKDPLVLDRYLAQQNRPQATVRKRALPGIVLEKDGWTIMVGKSGKDNDQILRRNARGNDIWLHARDFPGAYVFIKAKAGKSVPLEILLDAANLAVYHSKARSSGKANVYYTQVKYLRRAKDGPLGLVIPTQEKNLSVKFDPERLRGLNEPDD